MLKLQIILTTTDHCPVCHEGCAVDINGHVEEMFLLKEVKFWCRNHGAWYKPINIGEEIKKRTKKSFWSKIWG